MFNVQPVLNLYANTDDGNNQSISYYKYCGQLNNTSIIVQRAPKRGSNRALRSLKFHNLARCNKIVSMSLLRKNEFILLISLSISHTVLNNKKPASKRAICRKKLLNARLEPRLENTKKLHADTNKMDTTRIEEWRIGDNNKISDKKHRTRHHQDRRAITYPHHQENHLQ